MCVSNSIAVFCLFTLVRPRWFLSIRQRDKRKQGLGDPDE